MSLKRVDQIILQLFPSLSRSKVQSLIEKSKVLLQINQKWQVVLKPGQKLDPQKLSLNHFKILEDEELHYVSRGALKLKEAFRVFDLTAQNCVCLDVGLSTGGFSDFLLQSGAQKVLGVDVGRDQLHDKLKKDSRLMSFDKINAKKSLPIELLKTFFKDDEATFDRIVVDVSFISLSLIIPNLKSLLKKEGWIVVLIKPQFELTRGDLNKKGVVKDESLIDGVIKKIGGVFVENGLNIKGYCPSPIEGENGNKEILMLACWP